MKASEMDDAALEAFDRLRAILPLEPYQDLLKVAAAQRLAGVRAGIEAAEMVVKLPAGRSPSAIVVISDMVKRIRSLDAAKIAQEWE